MCQQDTSRCCTTVCKPRRQTGCQYSGTYSPHMPCTPSACHSHLDTCPLRIRCTRAWPSSCSCRSSRCQCHSLSCKPCMQTGHQPHPGKRQRHILCTRRLQSPSMFPADSCQHYTTACTQYTQSVTRCSDKCLPHTPCMQSGRQPHPGMFPHRTHHTLASHSWCKSQSDNYPHCSWSCKSCKPCCWQQHLGMTRHHTSCTLLWPSPSKSRSDIVTLRSSACNPCRPFEHQTHLDTCWLRIPSTSA